MNIYFHQISMVGYLLWRPSENTHTFTPPFLRSKVVIILFNSRNRVPVVSPDSLYFHVIGLAHNIENHVTPMHYHVP